MQTIGFIGLGNMGAPMAENLLRAGYDLVFFCRRDDVAERFQSLGGRRVQSPAKLAEQSDAVITIVTADEQVREVALGSQGLLHGASGDKMLIDMSTIGPDTIREVAANLRTRGMSVLDAPVSGGPWGAKAATLSIMVGGEKNDFLKAEPLLKTLGDKIFHMGPLGAGQTTKLVNQLIGAGIMALVGEGFALGRAAGLDLEKLFEVLSVSSAGSTLLEARGKKFILADRYEPGFTTDLMRKDVTLATRLAESLDVPLGVGAEVLQQYVAAVRQGFGKEDFASVAKVAAKAAGVSLVDTSRVSSSSD